MKFYTLFLILLILSCSQSTKEINQKSIDSLANIYKNEDLKDYKLFKITKKLDSLSEYKYSELKKKYDSIKKYDSVQYYTLQKIMEADTIDNYFKDLDLLWWDEDSKIMSEKEYKDRALKNLKKSD